MGKDITIKKMVASYLNRYGYGGLYSPGICACKLDDLFPCCDGPNNDCEAGYLAEGDSYCGAGFHIVSSKAEVEGFKCDGSCGV